MFPQYEVEQQFTWQYHCNGDREGECSWQWVPTATIIRRTYMLGGQAVATRITGDPDSNNNGLFYLHTDHLGSTSMLTTSSGVKITSSEARYLPYGTHRLAPTTQLTERDYTGQKENLELGLLYYNARFYVPGIGRFASADTIVPDPTNPQQYNRYSYVLGNPVKYTDPSGHGQCDAQGNCQNQPYTPPPPPVSGRVFYLNEIGNESGAEFNPSEDPANFQGYYLYMATLAVGANNVTHIPIYGGTVNETRIQMLCEAMDLCDQETQYVANTIIQALEDNPLLEGERLIIIGSSGGGTIAIEVLELLEEAGIYVDQVILRGSLVQEMSFGNFGRIDYITSHFDYYYSVFIDLNPSNGNQIHQHVVDFWGHVVPNAEVNREIGILMWKLLIEGASE